MTTTPHDNPVAQAGPKGYDLIIDTNWDLHAVPPFFPTTPETPRITSGSAYHYIRSMHGRDCAQRWERGEITPEEAENVAYWLADILRRREAER